jgi:hypothetical protein
MAAGTRRRSASRQCREAATATLLRARAGPSPAWACPAPAPTSRPNGGPAATSPGKRAPPPRCAGAESSALTRHARRRPGSPAPLPPPFPLSASLPRSPPPHAVRCASQLRMIPVAPLPSACVCACTLLLQAIQEFLAGGCMIGTDDISAADLRCVMDISRSEPDQ